ncbi:hypothetical protein ACFO9Q_06135 [Paenibacillus sp. GCM10023252]|uniref:hypothetical protein n=1 Tax=Paenibacillus sp. GCM10023252 TaxID=3252649 RepID=UPI00361B9520
MSDSTTTTAAWTEANITIKHEGMQDSSTTPRAMADLAGNTFPIALRVPDTAGEAIDFLQWYNAWRSSGGLDSQSPNPTQLLLEAADTFEAAIPWEELKEAAILFAEDESGMPLSKNGPIRLYVPNGSSKCLNVKSVVKLTFSFSEPSGGVQEASYGFKNHFSLSDLRRKE